MMKLFKNKIWLIISLTIITNTGNTQSFENEKLQFGEKEIWGYGSYSANLVYHYARTGDVNGDGRADMLLIKNNAIVVRISNGCEFGLETIRFPGDYGGCGRDCHYLFADVNGNNSVDLIKLTKHRAEVKLNTFIHDKDKGWDLWLKTKGADIFGYYGTRIADLNNDGKADLIGGWLTGIVVFPSTGFSFDNQNVQNWTNGNYQSFDQFLDANNDGFLDIYHEFALNGDSAVWVELSNGTSFPDPVNYSNMWEKNDKIPVFGYGDFTGDGKTDLVFKDKRNNKVLVKKSTGTGFTDYETWLDTDDFGAFYIVDNHFVDVTGDGRADLVSFFSDRVEVRRTVFECELNKSLLLNEELTTPINRGKNITTNGSLSLSTGQKANLIAAESIVLKSGFTAKEGSTLFAGIRVCPDSSPNCSEYLRENHVRKGVSNINSVKNNNIQKLTMIPNPSNGMVELNYGKLSERTELIILSDKGVEIFNQYLAAGTSNSFFNFSDFPKGIYFVKLGLYNTKKLIIN